ncbi:hypothetical protein FXO37_29258 [Capsicum annuum]|nr:hypothetical protein FXO37_29258 [Capsicum annuum]
MLECKQDNPNEFHVYVKGTVLKFAIFEFALISGLNCTSNIEAFQNPTLDDFVLMTKYFPEAKIEYPKNKFAEWYKMKFLDNDQDALWMTILFFTHMFLLSETDDATFSFIEFSMIKNIACRISNRILRICNRFVVGTKPKFEKFMNGMFSKYVYTNISPTVDELKCLQLPNHDGMDLKDSVNSTLPSTSYRQPTKVDQKVKMTVGLLPLDDFTTPPPLELLTKSKAKSDRSLASPSKRRKTDAERKKSVTGQENIKAHPSIEEVNESPSDTSNSIVDPINEEAPHEPSLMNFSEQTPPAEQTPPVVESVYESIQKINISGGTYHEQVLMKVDMSTIDSLVDKRFDDTEALMKKYHEEMMLAVKEKHDAPQKVVIDIDSSNKDLKKKMRHMVMIWELRKNNQRIYQKRSHADEKSSTESSLKFNFDDPAILRETIEVQNVQKKSGTEVKNASFQHFIYNTIAEISSLVSTIQADELLQKENLPDLILPTDNIEVRNEPQESIDNIIAEISTPVVAMEMKSVSPNETNNNECKIHDSQFPSVLPEANLGKQDVIKTRAPRNRKRTKIFRSSFTTEFSSSCKGKQSATINFPQKHPFDGYLISYDMPAGLIEEYCD